MKVDSQIIELLGRQRLIGDLLRDGLEVAVPVRDRGVDLIAYADLSKQVARFASSPIQMKAATMSAFCVDQKYERIVDLILAYVWHLEEPGKAVTYALPYAAAVQVAEKMGWAKTASWQHGGYTTTKPSKLLLDLLQEYRMSPGRWWELVVGQKTSAEPVLAPDALCPICSAEVRPSQRYPRYVCNTCADKAASADGRRLVFSNVGMSGGSVARYADTGEKYSGHECFVGGIKCHADGARFGGIVIEGVG